MPILKGFFYYKRGRSGLWNELWEHDGSLEELEEQHAGGEVWIFSSVGVFRGFEVDCAVGVVA